MTIFDKEIEPRDETCDLFNNGPKKIDPYVNIQVKIRGCNADCSFCDLKEFGKFDEDKYIENLKKISDKVIINKINFTGGEPTLNLERLKRLICKSREVVPDAYIVINTNGYRFEKLFNENVYEMVDNIQLSRHHYDDKINNKILGFDSVSKHVIKSISSNITDKRFLNFSCNLINGYIDNKIEVFKYLDDASSLEVKWTGFVTLIPLNKFCIENNIRFDDLNLESDRFINTKHWKNGDKCECFNYVYMSTDRSDPMRVYNKITKKCDLNHILVYDGEHFNIGFSENILI